MKVFAKNIVALLLVVVMSVGLTRPAYAILDKTRVAAHLGIAYFCYHHWVANPMKAGSFAQGAQGRTKAMVKAGAALLFAVHEVKVANKIAHKSKDPLLQKMAGAMDGMAGSFASLGQKLKSGKGGASDLDMAGKALGGVDGIAQGGGFNIKDIPVKIPGLG